MKVPELRISELFFSLQGESTFAGLPCIMVRLTGCNLRCAWCDTAYAFHGGEKRSIDAILSDIARFPSKRVEITGGEPLLQAATPLLAKRLLDLGYTVLCETSGERPISGLPEGVHRIVDLKAPSSGESHRVYWPNLDALNAKDELKIVVGDREDFDWVLGILREHALLGRLPVMVSPVHGRLALTDLAAWILESGLDIRLNLQLHKIIWGEKRGV